MIIPDGYMNIGKIIDLIYNRGGFTIGKLKLCKMSKENAANFMENIKENLFMIF